MSVSSLRKRGLMPSHWLMWKSDGSRQAFDPQKIKRGIIKSCEKRPVSMTQIDEIVMDIEKRISNSLDQEVPSSKIGEMVMEALKNLDEISYVRFAAVYRRFKDITTFITKRSIFWLSISSILPLCSSTTSVVA